jgi:hypothetical protein
VKVHPIVLSILIAAPLIAAAQELPVNGTVSVNYRFVDVAGREQKYRELFNLPSGPSLSMQLTGKPRGEDPFADSYALDFYGVGSDPFPGGQLRMSKTGRWDLRVNYRESAYFWNRNDDADHPTGLHGLTTNHDWDTERRLGSIHFNHRTTQNLRITLQYNRNSRTGAQYTTRVVDYIGAAGTFTSFQRANPYQVGTILSDPGNVDDVLHRFLGGVSYTKKKWNVFYNAGYQQFTEKLTLENLRSPQRSINIDDNATANELLTSAKWNEFRRLRSPISQFSYTGQPLTRLQLRGYYIFYRFTGPATIDSAFNGLSRSNATGTLVAPYAITETDRATLKETNNVIDQGFTIQASRFLNVLADYRYTRFTIHGVGQFQGVNNGVTTTGTADNESRFGLHQADLVLEFIPNRTWTIRPGVRLLKRDITVLDDGIADPRASRRSKFASPMISVAYTPSDRLSLRGDFQNTTNGGPYTRISPRTERTFRFTGIFDATDKFRVENNTFIRNGKFSTTQFENSWRSSGATLTYDVDDRFSLFGGFTYDSFFATAAVTFLRGVAPLNATWRDQTINRVWQAGIDASPADRVELRVSGNYLRTTGAGEISGEPTTFGPVRWPMVTGTASYNFPKIGRLAVDLQRSYYIETLMSGDNFSANILSLRWSRDF